MRILLIILKIRRIREFLRILKMPVNFKNKIRCLLFIKKRQYNASQYKHRSSGSGNNETQRSPLCYNSSVKSTRTIDAVCRLKGMPLLS